MALQKRRSPWYQMYRKTWHLCHHYHTLQQDIFCKQLPQQPGSPMGKKQVVPQCLQVLQGTWLETWKIFGNPVQATSWLQFINACLPWRARLQQDPQLKILNLLFLNCNIKIRIVLFLQLSDQISFRQINSFFYNSLIYIPIQKKIINFSIPAHALQTFKMKTNGGYHWKLP